VATTAGTLALSLVVNDGSSDSAPDTVVVTVRPPNQPPVASAGADQTVRVSDTIILDGSASSDPDGDALSYRWSSPWAYALSSQTAPNPTFAPNGDGLYFVALVVSDGQVESAPDTVMVTITPATPVVPALIAYLPGGAAMEFVWIEPGTFMMGDALIGDLPHQVTLSQGFYLGKYEVTQDQWQSVMGSSPWAARYQVNEGANYPAVYISWRDLQAFVRRLDEDAGVDMYRLPTEAQWEYACRAGTATGWSCGDDEARLPEYAWYRATDAGADLDGAQLVGTKAPNPWGLYDCHGNVSEWCHDWFAAYARGSALDPTGPASGTQRIVRGGFFYADARSLRSGARSANDPDFRHAHLGFRLLRLETPVPLPSQAVADAGGDRNAVAGEVLQLDASGSHGGDAAAALTYRWSEEPSNPVTGLLADPESAHPTFSAAVPGVYRLRLVVAEGGSESDPASVTITVVAEPSLEELEVQLPGGAMMQFIWVAPGEFAMGSPDGESGRGDDETLHRTVIAEGYYLARYELTVAQWQSVMGTRPFCDTDPGPSGSALPAECISWDAVQRFTYLLNVAAGDSIYRLPTEAEWEYACRAGATTAWSFGDDERLLADYAWYRRNTLAVDLGAPQEVGTKRPNQWAFHDMHGNVAEWCQNLYGESPGTSSPYRSIRGGAYLYEAQYLRSAARAFQDPAGGSHGLGARILRRRR
ncbi:MAG: SUMF1/EgtB/PvdO family nonheme iron enzyme, partial [Gemmatimonadota bacterium]